MCFNVLYFGQVSLAKEKKNLERLITKTILTVFWPATAKTAEGRLGLGTQTAWAKLKHNYGYD